jgi:hypothetical protein
MCGFDDGFEEAASDGVTSSIPKTAVAISAANSVCMSLLGGSTVG